MTLTAAQVQAGAIHVRILEPHAKQADFIYSKAKRKVVRAGRRSGKTVGMSILAVEAFLKGVRVLYATPTSEQIDRFWTEVTRALAEPIDAGIFKKNETRHIIELEGTEQRIRAKTAWNADSLRGDYADLLILDEWQNIDETAWDEVGVPMLLDNDGDAVFIYTPASLRTRSTNKARDPQHAAKMFKKAKADKTGRWAVWHFTSHDNPYISQDALGEITKDMTSEAFRQEILAEDVDEAPGALWKRKWLDDNRLVELPDELVEHEDVNGVITRTIQPLAMDRIVIGVDPTATESGDEAGIIGAGRRGEDFYTMLDASTHGTPEEWATAAVNAYKTLEADEIIAEANNGGEMVAAVILQVDRRVPVRLVHATRGKRTRAEPVSILAQQGRDHHVGLYGLLENEMCLWTPGDPSPNRMDAKVWAYKALMDDGGGSESVDSPFYD